MKRGKTHKEYKALKAVAKKAEEAFEEDAKKIFCEIIN